MATILHVPQEHVGHEMINIMDDSGNSYEDTIENFSLDYGSDFPPLPTGDIGREYNVGKRHFTFSSDHKGTKQDKVWVEGDAILAALTDIIAAQILRNLPPEEVFTFEETKVNAKDKIDRTSETTRTKYITRGPGQAMVYQEKSDEATDFVAAGYPADVSSYPFLQAEMNALGLTSAEAADSILAQKSAWIVVGAAIEEIRLRAKKDVDEAADIPEVESITSAAVVALGEI